jgi:Protein of unknown function (DUF1573)
MKMTLLKFFALAGALGITASSLAQTNPASPSASAIAPPTTSGPRIEFADLNYDFGKVDAGEVVKHDFVFINMGDQLLVISDVRPGCGCTTAGAWDKQVEPGKTGHIPVQFNSGGYGGSVLKTVTVSCNDPARKSVLLQIKGAIWKAFDVSPMYAVFNLLPEGQTNQTQVIRIISKDDQPVTVSDPACNNPAFKTELKTVQEGKEFELRVTVSPSQASGNFSGSITMKTSAPKMPVISLTAFAMLQPLLAVNPPQISLPAGPLPKATPITVTIQNNSTNPLVLSDPVINAPGTGVQLKEIQPGRLFNLTINFPAGFQKQPEQSIEAVVKSSLSKFPVVKVPVLQPTPPPAIATPVALPSAAPANSPAVHSAASATPPAPVAVSPAASQ